MKTFETDCVGSGDGAAIQAMVDSAQDITRRTFCRHVDQQSREEVERALGYQVGPGPDLTLARDWHVSYHKSTYRGRPCVYFRWSAIEHIFTEAA